MAQALRLVYSHHYLQNLASKITAVNATFPQNDFIQAVMQKDWDELALKARMGRITQVLRQTLPADYSEAVHILKSASEHFSGYAAMFFPDFVALYGLNDWDTSLPALAYFTQFSSSEFAVRPFILKDPERMMAQMLRWSTHENAHIRRLASEGCRPRLPWAQALPEFKQDPTPILPILKNLLQDNALYVRKSVANNLNDIAKDHPELVLGWVEEELGKHHHSDWILKHGSRTLLKQAHPRALALFSLGSIEHIELPLFELGNHEVAIGERLPFRFLLKSRTGKLGKLRIEYAIHFVKADGKTRRKVFKVSENDFADAEKQYDKYHSLKQMSTRKHYPGEHKLELIVNGNVLAERPFYLTQEKC
ncbi:DNA alkylation repair protein [Alteromonas sp. a30]|uniref:DNA alkylation repair protein n=1 Tax=Alteromonas sp. a30 TaxID=2730917 RepID=UPI00228245AD|nr:DNA alkylation repair protein [Alteromonas sp. a30]MCY7296161.1 DNA alkylation repair protein [Alteromonas sp. a30]